MKVCQRCGEYYDNRNFKYCSDTCATQAQAEQQRKHSRQHYYQHKPQNTCNKCGVVVPKYRQICDKCKSRAQAECIVCGVKMRRPTQVFCRECYTKTSSVKNLVKMLRAIDQYQQINNSLHAQVDELNKTVRCWRERCENLEALRSRELLERETDDITF